MLGVELRARIIAVLFAPFFDEIRKILRDRKISIISEDVGGTLGRKIIFNTHNGDTAAIKTSRIRRMDWLPEWEHLIGVKRIAYERGE